MGYPGIVGNKTHQHYLRCVGTLNDILEGYDNQAIMASTFKELIEVLHDPELLYSEVSSILSALAGRIPSKLEESICATIDAAKSKGDAQEFPVVRIKSRRAPHPGLHPSPRSGHVPHTTWRAVRHSQTLHGSRAMKCTLSLIFFQRTSPRRSCLVGGSRRAF